MMSPTACLCLFLAAGVDREAQGEQFQAYKDHLISNGWKLDAGPQAISRKQLSGKIAEPGPFAGLKKNSRVTIDFGWIVVAEHKIEPNTTRKVELKFLTEETEDLELISQTRLLSLPISRARALTADGTKVSTTIRTGREPKLIIALQESAEIKDGSTSVVFRGHLRTYAYAIFERRPLEETDEHKVKP